MKRSSSAEWSGSSIKIARSSEKTVWASSNQTPCFWTLDGCFARIPCESDWLHWLRVASLRCMYKRFLRAWRFLWLGIQRSNNYLLMSRPAGHGLFALGKEPLARAPLTGQWARSAPHCLQPVRYANPQDIQGNSDSSAHPRKPQKFGR